MTTKTNILKILSGIATAIEGLSENELDQLATGKGKLIFVASDKQKDIQSERYVVPDEFLQQLNNCTDRESARKVLSMIGNRDALALFAKSQKIHIAKHDRREDIENKIIEFIIGGKLRTEAIQALNLKGGNSS